MRFSVCTTSTPEWSPEEVVLRLAEQGWDGVEWRIADQPAAGQADSTSPWSPDQPEFWQGNRATWPLSSLEDDPDAIAKVTANTGLAVSGLAAHQPAAHQSGAEQPAAERKCAERILAATAALSAERVRIRVPGVRRGESYREVFTQARSDLSWVAERSAHHGVKVLIDLHPGTVAASASAAYRLVDGLDPAAVGVVHNLGNLLIEGYENPAWAFDLLGPYLAYVQLRNIAWAPVDTTSDGTACWQHRWAPLREGLGDVGGYLRALRAHGYTGWVSVADFSTDVPLEERTADNLAYLRSFV